ncbi:MAG TPA: 3D domain-containing protein [Haliangiales bacterium]|nr:3D domain-containing protein [Haliangiales bacterium]
MRWLAPSFVAAGLAGCTAEITGDLPDAPDSPDSRDAPPDGAERIDARAPGVDAPAVGPDAGPGPILGTFALTYYWVTLESDYPGAADTTLYDRSCVALATVPSAFAQSLVIEGTGRLADGRTLNYAGACPCLFSPCFVVLDAAHPWGTGADGRALVPFRSIAVDPTVLAIGARYWVKELAGVTMPGAEGGFVHDGCVSADDTGGHILGMHIDFFAALRSNYLILDNRLGLAAVTLYEGGARCP